MKEVKGRVVHELLYAAAKRRNDSSERLMAELAARIGDWDTVLRIAREHRVLPLLFVRLQQAGAVTPPAVRERLQAAYQRNAFRCLANTRELLTILEAFNRDGIRAIPFKGVALGASLYGDMLTRQAGDVDILIDLDARQRTREMLQDRGYELITPVGADGAPSDPKTFELHFERPSDGMVVELRWRIDLALPRFRRDLNLDWVWPHKQNLVLAGGVVPNLDPEMTLLLLCMHGSKHQWSRLLWVCDVAQLLAVNPDLDWRMVAREAKRAGTWRTLALGVLLAHRVAGAPVEPRVLLRFKMSLAAAGLAKHIAEFLLEAPGSMPAALVPYNVKLLSMRDQMRLVANLNLLQPGDRDIQVVKLPQRLHNLYYLIRPFRILLDRSPR